MESNSFITWENIHQQGLLLALPIGQFCVQSFACPFEEKTFLIKHILLRWPLSIVGREIAQSRKYFLSSANEVSTGPTCQFLWVCLSGLFFKASNWIIYWLLTVVQATYLSDKVFRAWLSSATLRFFSLAEQCHTQKFYLRCFKSDFDAVKSKFGLLNE